MNTVTVENNAINAVVKSNLNTALTKVRFKEVVAHWKSYVTDLDNKPSKCLTYGTKIEGGVWFQHYLIHAILRGRSTQLVTHSVESETYIDAMRELKNISTGASSNRRLTMPFGVTCEELVDVLKFHFSE